MTNDRVKIATLFGLNAKRAIEIMEESDAFVVELRKRSVEGRDVVDVYITKLNVMNQTEKQEEDDE